MATISISGLTYFNDLSKNTIVKEVGNVSGNLWRISVPFTNPETTGINVNTSVPFFAKESTLFINGEYSSSESDILAFYNEIKTQALSPTQSSRLYTNPFGATFQVKINDITHEVDNVYHINKIRYTIELFVEAK